MKRSEFRISQMDCPSEEQMIKMKLSGFDSVKSLDFDIANRKLDVHHDGGINPIKLALEELKLGSELVLTVESQAEFTKQDESQERKLLWAVLIINFLFFGIEIIAGVLSGSMGLVADSLDMLADTIVYILALMAVGAAAAMKSRVARFAGYFQMLLAVVGFAEVLRRFFSLTDAPDFTTMIVVSVFALIANALSLYILQKGKSDEAHMKASMIFTSNDIIINSGVIMAGVLVKYFNSSYPDLIIGAIVFLIVANGAFRILKLDTGVNS
ncbi:MAG: cation transporter [Flavobacteriales bacterium]